MKKRIIIAITGATGTIYGVRILEHLKQDPNVETHLVISRAAVLTARAELDISREQILDLADVVHNEKDIGATIASGSFITEGMIIAPCSMKTLAAIANGLADNLVTRAADVILKERRKLVLMARETPLNLVHLRNMTYVTEMGAIVFPPVPAFYIRPDSLSDIVNHSVARALDLFSLDSEDLLERWKGVSFELLNHPDKQSAKPAHKKKKAKKK